MRFINLPIQINLVHFVSHIHMIALPMLMPLLVKAHIDEIGFMEISFAIAIFNIVSALVQTPVGIFVDRLGPKRALKIALLIGSLSFLSLGVLLNYASLMIAMAFAGLANAFYHPADYALLSQNIQEQKMGRAFSFHTFSGYLGFAVTPGMIYFLATSFNISMALLVTSGIGFLALILLWPNVNELKKIVSTSNTTSQERPSYWHRFRTTFSFSILTLLALFFFLNLSSGAIQNYSVSALTNSYYAISEGHATLAVTLFLICGSLGVLYGGYLADKTQRHGLIATAALFVTSLLALVIGLNLLASLMTILAIAVMGFLFGMIAPSRDMMVRNVAPKGKEGQVFGIVSTGFNLGGVAGPLLFGWFIDETMPTWIFYSCAVFMAVTALIALGQEWRPKRRAVTA